MSHLLVVCAYLLIFLLVGCEQTSQTSPTPAMLMNPSASVKIELQNAIVKLKGGVAPHLADNVFATDNALLIENVHNLAGPLEEPVYMIDAKSVSRFELQLREGLCVLSFPKTQNYVPLQRAKCLPIHSLE